jgi:hypothetical protein
MDVFQFHCDSSALILADANKDATSAKSFSVVDRIRSTRGGLPTFESWSFRGGEPTNGVSIPIAPGDDTTRAAVLIKMRERTTRTTIEETGIVQMTNGGKLHAFTTRAKSESLVQGNKTSFTSVSKNTSL